MVTGRAGRYDDVPEATSKPETSQGRMSPEPARSTRRTDDDLLLRKTDRGGSLGAF